jgi:hypothetical protein
MRTLVEATMNDDGTFVLLRLGQDPGEERIAEMLRALKALREELAGSEVVSREVAYVCACIMHFSGECLANMGQQPSPVRERLTDRIVELRQAAFNVLAGERADG